MSQIQKKVVLILSSFLVAGLLLAGTVVALAATTLPFTLMGTLNYVGTNYSVDSQPITVTLTTACTDLQGAVVSPCSGLAGSTVEATGIYTGTTYTATAITELGTFIGVINEMDTSVTPNLWTVGSMEFEVDGNTALGGTFAVGDVAEVTYKKDGAAWLALAVDPVATLEFQGEVTVIGADAWTVGGQVFAVNPDTMLYDNPALQDIVKVTYYVVDTENIAVKIELFAPFKNENSRCEGRAADFAIPRGIEVKLGEDFDEAQVRAMFCQGFGWGEIVQAFKWASGDLSPADLLAKKASGLGWGQIKKEAANTPLSTEGETLQIQNQQHNQNQGQGKPENPGNSGGKGNGKGHNK